jgi:hypothetical protein
VKALIVANEFLETEVCELMQAGSHAYARGRFETYTGWRSDCWSVAMAEVTYFAALPFVATDDGIALTNA